MVALQAAAAKAREIGTPQCIAVVDRGGHLLAFLRMDGAKVLSQYSATQKAVTAASSAAPSGELPEPLAAGPQGRFTNLRGGLPILVEGRVIGAIGVGSGTAEQDLIVARAGIDALMASLDGMEPG
jgi:glc operon protein GlcG